MTKQEVKEALFEAAASRIAAEVQHACTLATGLDNPAEGFEKLHMVLESCHDGVEEYEAREIEFAPEGEHDAGN